MTDDAMKEYADYICKQVLADSLSVAEVDNPAEDEILDIDGTEVRISVIPV